MDTEEQHVQVITHFIDPVREWIRKLPSLIQSSLVIRIAIEANQHVSNADDWAKIFRREFRKIRKECEFVHFGAQKDYVSLGFWTDNSNKEYGTGILKSHIHGHTLKMDRYAMIDAENLQSELRRFRRVRVDKRVDFIKGVSTKLTGKGVVDGEIERNDDQIMALIIASYTSKVYLDKNCVALGIADDE